MSKKSKALPRGFVNNIILQSLVDGDKYGYEIIKEVEDITNGEIILKQPSLYSSLKRFEARGFISSYWGDSTIGGRRHYYTITEEGKRHFEEQIKSGEIAIEDIVYENVEQEVVEELKEIEEKLEEVKQENQAKKTENSEKNELQEKASIKKVIVDVDDEYYNVFDLLESSNIKDDVEVFEDEVGIEKDEDNISLDTSDNVEAEKLKNLKKAEEVDKVDDVSEKQVLESETEVEASNLNTSHSPTFIEQTSFDIKDLVFENEGGSTQKEDAEIITKASSIKDENDKTIEWNESDENNIEKNKPKENIDPVKIYVDEFGIKKSSEEKPKRKPKKIDNVGVRREYKDPLSRTNIVVEKKEKKQDDNKSNKIDIEKTYTQKDFKETDKKIAERIQEAVVQKFGKIESLDYKSLLGDVYFDEKEIAQQKLENDTVKLHDSYEENYFEPYKVEEDEVSTVKNTPYTALEESLEKEGFKFKSYNLKFAPSKKRPEFLLVNKIGFYLGIIMFALMLVQFSGFVIYVFNSNYIVKSLDKVIIGLSFSVAVAVLIATLAPYVINRKKRKYNSFKLSTTLVYMLVVFTSLVLLTYAINSFFGLTFKNVGDYSVTLFMPIILFSNLLIAPVIYRLLISNKKFY